MRNLFNNNPIPQDITTDADVEFNQVTVGNTGLIVGSSTPFSDSSGTLTLQNIDALDSTTKSTIQEQYTVNAQTGITYTIQASDWGKLVTFNNASDITVTLPQQSTEATTTSFWCDYEVLGAGTVTFIKEGAETITTGSNTDADQGAKGSIRRPSTTSWGLTGGTVVNSWEHTLFVQTVADVTYNSLKFNFAGTLTEISSISRSGTCTATTSIDGTGVTATANSVSTSDDTQAVTGNNEFSSGEYLTTAITSNSSCLDMCITYKGTYRQNI